MNNIAFQRINLDLEYLVSEMEIKLNSAKITHTEMNYSDAENKIEMLKNIKANFYTLFYDKEELVKSHIRIEYQNKLLVLKSLELEQRIKVKL